MATTSIAGGGNHNVTVFGNGNVVQGNGNDGVNIRGSGSVTVGSGRDTINIAGNGTVNAGSGNDFIRIIGSGHVSVGGGADTITLYGSGSVTQRGVGGHDTISIGSGGDTIHVEGNATVVGVNPFLSLTSDSFHSGHGLIAFRNTAIATHGGATIAGGELHVTHSFGSDQDIAVSGNMTLLGGSSATQFIGGTGSTVMKGGSGHDTFVGGSGHDTMTGGVGRHNVFEFVASEQGGQHIITNFVAGDQLVVEGHDLAYLVSHHEVTVQQGNTVISIDGGKTTIELQGVAQPGTGPAHPTAPSHLGRLDEHDPSYGLRHVDKF